MTMQASRKDQASLLLEAIKSISHSKHGGAAKETSRVQLERELQECDIQLTKFVSEHYEDLGNVMSTFEQIAQRIRDSKLKILRIRDNLHNCRNLLQCKRAELRDGWIQAVEQRNIASLLDRIASVKNTLDKVDGYLAKKYYLHAAEQLATARFQYKSELSRIEPLKSLGSELDAKLEHVYQQLMDELNQQIYIRSPSSAIQLFHRHMSSRRSSSRRFQLRSSNSKLGAGSRSGGSGTSGNPNTLKAAQILPRHLASERASSSSGDSSSSPKISLAALFTPIPQIPRPLLEDTSSGANPESDQVHFLAILLESLGVLGLLRQATDNLQVNLKKELSGVVKRATQQILDTLDDDSDDQDQNRKNLTGEPAAHVTASSISAWFAFVNPLAYASKSPTLLSLTDKHRQSLKDLIELIFSQFKCVLAIHRIIGELLEQARNSPAGVDAGPYSISCVWSVMDGYLCQLVQLYANDNPDDGRLTLDGGDGGEFYADFTALVLAKDVNSSSIDIGPFFTRRKQPPQIGALFRFANSGQAQTMDIYMREVRQQQYGGVDAPPDRHLLMSDVVSPLSAAGAGWQRHLVCRPEVFNVAPLYGLIADFVGEVTEVLDPDTPKSQAIGSSSVMVLMHNIIAQGFINGLDAAVNRFLGEVPRMLDGLRLIRVPSSLSSHSNENNNYTVVEVSAGDKPPFPSTTRKHQKQQDNGVAIRYCLIPFVASRMQLDNMTQLILALPDFADPLAGICERCFNCLSSHSKASYERLARYRGLEAAQQQFTTTPLTRAAIIASDQDISRVFKTNAVWYELERSLTQASTMGDDSKSGAGADDSVVDAEMIVTREDIAADLSREVDMIVQELRGESATLKVDALMMRLCIGGASCRQPLTSDSLAGLARLGDSLYWFVHQLTTFVNQFKVDENRRQSIVNVSSQLPSPASRCAKLSHVLMEVANDLKQLADTCFLTLHLDTLLRCAAFLSTGPLDQHLGSGGSNGSDNNGQGGSLSDNESDALVHKIESELALLESILSASGGNSDSMVFDEDSSLVVNPLSRQYSTGISAGPAATGGGLSRPKMQYIYSGVSRLAAVLLVRYAGTRCSNKTNDPNVVATEPFNEITLNKMLRTIVALQAAFSRISGCNQADLDYARRYYELLYLTPSEVVQRIVSGGATQFSEREYDILLNLMQHNPQHRHIPPEEFKAYRDQVRDLIVAKNKIMLQQKRQQQQLQQSAANVLASTPGGRPSSRSGGGAKLSETKPAVLL